MNISNRKGASPSKSGNTPKMIINRSEGAYFFCATCQKEYRNCKCRVYVSAEASEAVKTRCQEVGDNTHE
jgi:hypothetical protein